MGNILDNDYKSWIVEVKAAWAVNAALIEFYWDLGNMISDKQTAWGTKFIEQLSKDLQSEFSDMKGLSASNLKYCRGFYQFYQNGISQQLVDQLKLIPWGHNILIFTKSESVSEATFYIQQTIENAWGRESLALQIKTNLYQRQGMSVNNFSNTLPAPMSELAEQTLKDPYHFDFVGMSVTMKERDLENQLVKHISKFLLELGKGFAFVGQQYHLAIANQDYYIDLLFYHIKLKCFVVIELKNSRFMPEYAGKINFYLSAVDTLLKQADDKPSIGILLCRDKNNIEAEFALRDMGKPIGVSEFSFTEILPDELKSSLPTIEEFEEEFRNLNSSIHED